jgi:hypothetical protein
VIQTEQYRKEFPILISDFKFVQIKCLKVHSSICMFVLVFLRRKTIGLQRAFHCFVANYKFYVRVSHSSPFMSFACDVTRNYLPDMKYHLVAVVHNQRKVTNMSLSPLGRL